MHPLAKSRGAVADVAADLTERQRVAVRQPELRGSDDDVLGDEIIAGAGPRRRVTIAWFCRSL
jgi:hypothetical protein